ncbi:succinate dehydrogenase assembly factor 2 [Gaertneriomyces sp. JEL0708]|nr:succinate dehydrogenase assembly factor 2 [Gaertneriomyces sp. JEL0708]
MYWRRSLTLQGCSRRLTSTIRLPGPSICSRQLAARANDEFPDWSRKPPAPDSENPDYLPDFKIPKPVRPADEPTPKKIARLIYSSRKRGILETDLLLSTFAGEKLAQLPRQELDEYDDLLEENDWDIYYWITGTEGKIPPKRVQEMKVFPKLVEHAKNKGKKILRMPELSK